jgi:hypothetical protein
MLFWFLNWPSRKTRPPSAEERARGEGAQPLRSNPFAKSRRDGTAARRKVLRYRFDFGARPDTPGTANAAPMLGHAARADALATRLSNQYRSAYVWIFALAPVAVMWAVLSVLFKEWKPLLVVFELVTVSSVAAIYLRTRAQDPVAERRSPPGWLRRLFPRSQDTHQRWLDARLIAESQRSGQLLAWAGFAGRRPIDPPSGTAAGHGDHHGDHLAKDHHAAPRPLWAPHYANAIAALPELPLDEEAGTPQAVITPRRIVALAEAAGTVIAGQTGYHDLNHRQLEALNHRLDTFSLRAIQWAAGFSLAYLVFWAVSQPVPGWAPWSAVLAKGSPVRTVRQDMSDNQQATG